MGCAQTSAILKLDQCQQEQVVSWLLAHRGKQAVAVMASPDRPALLGSRLGGMPYWDFTRSYPADRKGVPLRLLCQINFNDLAICAHPQLPQQGLLQIFCHRMLPQRLRNLKLRRYITLTCPIPAVLIMMLSGISLSVPALI